MSEVLAIGREGRVLTLTLNRPEKRNALSLELATELVRALQAAVADTNVGAIVLAGNGKAFCAGMDLSEIGEVSSRAVDAVHEALFTFGAWCTKPVLAAVHGAALAGGTGLAANAHVVVAAQDAKFGLTEIRIGLWPLVVFRSVALAVGERRAVEMSLTGRIVSAGEAREMALVHENADDPMLRAMHLAQQLSEYSAFVMQQGLVYVREARGQSWADSGALAQRMRGEILHSADFAEGVAAFHEKRAPRWNNR